MKRITSLKIATFALALVLSLGISTLAQAQGINLYTAGESPEGLAALTGVADSGFEAAVGGSLPEGFDNMESIAIGAYASVDYTQAGVTASISHRDDAGGLLTGTPRNLEIVALHTLLDLGVRSTFGAPDTRDMLVIDFSQPVGHFGGHWVDTESHPTTPGVVRVYDISDALIFEQDLIYPGNWNGENSTNNGIVFIGVVSEAANIAKVTVTVGSIYDESDPSSDADANLNWLGFGDMYFGLSTSNQPPIAVAAGPYLGAVNELITFDGSGSTDPDNDDLTEAWTADGGTVSGSTYTAGNVPGVYDVCLTVNDGTVESEPSCTMVVVYDPSGGFVTGGGWIDSPAGAYAADSTLTGKANFGFVAKYKKGANVPDGNTQFKFKAGDLNFHSSSYEWLVVAGNKAQFRGEGTINGEGSYTFMIWADDDDPDTFRIHIWGDTGTVYDNGPQQALGGGSIKVHNK